jgi:hypothetical protein
MLTLRTTRDGIDRWYNMLKMSCILAAENIALAEIEMFRKLGSLFEM